jgi:signal transduction histidine kinase
MRAGDRTPDRRLLIPAVLLSVFIGCTASLTLCGRAAGHDATEALLAANRLERLVVDLERGQRGYVATGDARALSPWHAARAAFAWQAATLQRLAAENSPEQGRRARDIVRAATSYPHEHAEPLVRIARQDHDGARSAVSRAEGPRRIEAIRRQFDRFAELQRRLAMAHERDAVPTVRRVLAMAAGASGALLLLFLLVGYVRRGTRPAPPLGRTDVDGLRRVATLVAYEAGPREVWTATAAELGRALGAEHAMITRYEPDGTAAVVAHWSAPGAPPIMPPLGGRWPVEDETVTDVVGRTGRPAHLCPDVSGAGPIGAWIREHDVQEIIGHPIAAGNRLWGTATVLSRRPPPWPPGAKETMREFATLAGAAVTAACRRAELAAARVRLVEAADATRRRIERLLHERAQQRLVTVGLGLRVAEAAAPADQDGLRVALANAARDVTEIIEDLREVARELYPAFLAKGGVEPALRALARRSAVPVELDVRAGRRPPPNVAVTIHQAVAESLRNATAHARATVVQVTVDLTGPVHLTIRDDGVGGACLAPGAALAMLRDRVEALGGALDLDSPPGSGTTVRVTVPFGGPGEHPSRAI